MKGLRQAGSVSLQSASNTGGCLGISFVTLFLTRDVVGRVNTTYLIRCCDMFLMQPWVRAMIRFCFISSSVAEGWSSKLSNCQAFKVWNLLQGMRNFRSLRFHKFGVHTFVFFSYLWTPDCKKCLLRPCPKNFVLAR